MQTLSDKKNPFVGIVPEAPTKESALPSQSARVTADGELWFPPLPVTTMPGLDAEPQSRGKTGISSGVEGALKALSGTRLHGEDVALLVKDRQARIDFFGTLQARDDEGKVCTALHDLIAADGPESYWFVRKTAFERLRLHSSVPLTASLGALVATKDGALRARILEVVMKDLSFPLSPEKR